MDRICGVLIIACMTRKKAPVGSLLKRPLGTNFIREWREYRETTQERLAGSVSDLTGKSMTAATLSRIENRKNPYSQWQIEAIAEILECSPAELIARDPTSAEYSDEMLLARLSKRSREAARQMLVALAAQDSPRRTGTKE